MALGAAMCFLYSFTEHYSSVVGQCSLCLMTFAYKIVLAPPHSSAGCSSPQLLFSMLCQREIYRHHCRRPHLSAPCSAALRSHRASAPADSASTGSHHTLFPPRVRICRWAATMSSVTYLAEPDTQGKAIWDWDEPNTWSTWWGEKQGWTLIREHKFMTANEIIEFFCELIVTRLPIIAK